MQTWDSLFLNLFKWPSSVIHFPITAPFLYSFSNHSGPFQLFGLPPARPLSYMWPVVSRLGWGVWGWLKGFQRWVVRVEFLPVQDVSKSWGFMQMDQNNST